MVAPHQAECCIALMFVMVQLHHVTFQMTVVQQMTPVTARQPLHQMTLEMTSVPVMAMLH